MEVCAYLIPVCAYFMEVCAYFMEVCAYLIPVCAQLISVCAHLLTRSLRSLSGSCPEVTEQLTSSGQRMLNFQCVQSAAGMAWHAVDTSGSAIKQPRRLKIFDEQLVPIFQRMQKRNAEQPGPDNGEDDEPAPTPSISGAGSAIANSVAVASRKRSLVLNPVDEELAEDSGDKNKEPRHDHDINCPACNKPGSSFGQPSAFYRHLREPKACPKISFPESNTPMDLTVQLHLRAGHEIPKNKRPQGTSSKAPAPPPARPLDPCNYCGERESTIENEPLVKCIGYTEELSLPLKSNWFVELQQKLCGKTVHLSCVRKAQGQESEPGLYRGSVSIATAGPNVIRFCSDCFQKMEGARPDKEQEDEAAAAPAAAAGGAAGS